MSKKAVMPLTDYENACEIIREKTGTDALIKSGELTDKINKVFEQGKKTEYDRFWDTLQENGNRTSYECAFSANAFSWNDKTYNPKYPIVCGSDTTATANKTFYSIPLTDTKVPITIEGTRFDNTFAYSVYLKRIPSLTLNNLVRIQNPFQNCRALEELNVYGTIDVNGLNLSYSPLLTKASLLTVINVLKDFSTLITFDEGATLTRATYSKISDNVLEEGKTYYLTFYSMEYGGNEEPLFIDNPRIAKKENVYGVGERVAIHYDVPYFVYPEKTYHFVIYQDGQELKELRYVEDESGNIWTVVGFDGDRIETIKTEQGEGTHTVTLGATNLAKLTDAEKVQATEKGWTLL